MERDVYCIPQLSSLLFIIIIIQQTPRQFSDNYAAFSKRKNTPVSHYGPFGFDAAWLVALAINMSSSESSNGQLLDIKTDNSPSDMIKNSLLKTNFKGVTVSTFD